MISALGTSRFNSTAPASTHTVENTMGTHTVENTMGRAETVTQVLMRHRYTLKWGAPYKWKRV